MATRGKRKQPERLSEREPKGYAIVRTIRERKPYECSRNDCATLKRVTILWYIGELSPLELYDFGGGNVVAPVPDSSVADGQRSYLTSHMFAYNTCFNLANSAPRSGLYIQNAAVPTV